MARRSFLSSAGLASAAALTAGYIPLRADDYPRLTPSRQFRVLTVNNAGGFRLCVHEGDLYYLSSNFQTGEQLLG